MRLPRPLRCLFAALAMLMATGSSAAPPPALRVVLDDNYPPYIFRDAQGEPQGLLKDLWTLWSQRSGIAVDLRPMDWSAALARMKRGDADVIDTIFETEERKKIYEFSQPYATIAVALFFHKSIGGITDAASAKGFNIGVKSGDACVEYLHARGIDDLKPYPSYEAQAAAAARQEVRVLCMDMPPALYFLNRDGVADQFRYTAPLYVGAFHWATARSRPDLKTLIEAGFDKIAPAERKAIEERWLGKPLEAEEGPWQRYARPIGYGLLATSLATLALLAWGWQLRRQVAARTASLTATLEAMRDKDVRIQELLEEQSIIFENAHVGIAMVCNRKILKCNQHIADMFGFSGPEKLLNSSTRALYCSDEAFETAGRQGYAQLAEYGYTSIETEMCRQDGTHIWVQQNGRSLDPAHAIDSPSIWVYTDITQGRLAEQALRQSRQMLAMAFDASPVAASIATMTDGRFIAANANYERDFGWTRDDLIGRTSLEVGLWPDVATRNRWVEAMRQTSRLVNYETTWMHKDGSQRHVSLSSEIAEIDGRSCILAYVTDITARKQAEADLRIAAVAFESQEGMIVTDAAGTILRVNRAFTETTGYAAEEAVGQTPRILKSGRHDEAFYRAMWETITRTGIWQGEIWDRRKDGQIYPKWLTISAVKDAAGRITHYIGTHYDISERKRAEEEIRKLAFFDQLTALPNRTLLTDRIKQTLAASARSGDCGALLFIDLDNFKTLNDTLGHDQGDMLLKQVAGRLTGSVRDGDTVARLGGDEFVLVLPALHGDQADAAGAVEMIAEKVLATLRQPYVLGQVSYELTASIGVTLFSGDVASIDDLMKQADLAMYKSKEAGRNQIRFFDPALETAIRQRAAWERDMRQALAQQQFRLHYQPQFAGRGQLTGVEALLRWQHPQRGMVPPGDFIPVAEETGQILALGQWVLDTACGQLAAWASRPEFAHLTIAVNVSARQFRQEDFVDQVMAALHRSGADPQHLKLELTESLLVENFQDIVAKMAALKARGVGFSLDDFGTGYSSLSYLKRLPLDQLKIDQSFVRDVLIDPNDAVIAKTIIALGHSLGLNVIAEGVETEEQLDFLAHAGCHAYQGYFFSRPLPAEQFDEFVRKAQRA